MPGGARRCEDRKVLLTKDEFNIQAGTDSKEPIQLIRLSHGNPIVVPLYPHDIPLDSEKMPKIEA